NRGLSLARGRYIAHMDADDLADVRQLAQQVAFLDAHPAVVLVGCRIRYTDEDGQDLYEHVPPAADEELRIALFDRNQFAHDATLARRQAVQLVGGYREQFFTAEDYDLWLRLNEVGEIASL